MSATPRSFLLTALLGCSIAIHLVAPRSAAQPPPKGLASPQLLYVTPAGGKAGSTLEVKLDGANLGNVTGLYFSHPGIKAEALGQSIETAPMPTKPKTGGGMAAPAATNSVKFKVTVAADVPLGQHDVRVLAANGVSNPRAFVIGDVPEVLELEPNNDVTEGQKIALNTVVYGAIANPVDVDYYVFSAKKDQRVVVSCLTSSIDSKLQPELTVYSRSNEGLLALSRNYKGNDALVDFTAASDGEYYVRVCHFAYIAGGPDCFYRLSVSTTPWIDAVQPSVVAAGKKATLTVYGRNLPGGKVDPEYTIDNRPLEKLTVTIDVPADPQAAQRLDYLGALEPVNAQLDGFTYRLKNPSGTSNPVLLQIAKAPVLLEQADNDSLEKAQPISVPVEIAGQIEKKADRDFYAFTAKKGDIVMLELLGERMGSPLDLYMQLINAETKATLVELDDNPELFGPQFYNKSEDPASYRFAVPADGRYAIMVSSRDAFVQAGPRHQYRLRISQEQPDFRLVAMPANTSSLTGCTLSQRGNELLNIFVYRQDGFSGDIALSAAKLPAGVTCPEQLIPAGSSKSVLVLSAAGMGKDWTGEIVITGTATINGKKVVREARSATLTWPVAQPANIGLSRLDRSVVLAVCGTAAFSVTPKLPTKTTIAQGEKITVPLKLERLSDEAKKVPVKLVSLSAPKEFTVPALTYAVGANDQTLTFTSTATTPPGTYTIVVGGEAELNYITDVKTKKTGKAKIIEPGLPITFTVLPSKLATFTIAPTTAKIKPGTDTEVVISVKRLFNYEGAFKVELVTGADSKGLTVQEVTIPAGENEAKLKLCAEPGVNVGTRNLTFRAVAMFQDRYTTTHETKTVVTITK